MFVCFPKFEGTAQLFFSRQWCITSSYLHYLSKIKVCEKLPKTYFLWTYLPTITRLNTIPTIPTFLPTPFTRFLHVNKPYGGAQTASRPTPALLRKAVVKIFSPEKQKSSQKSNEKLRICCRRSTAVPLNRVVSAASTSQPEVGVACVRVTSSGFSVVRGVSHVKGGTCSEHPLDAPLLNIRLGQRGRLSFSTGRKLFSRYIVLHAKLIS